MTAERLIELLRAADVPVRDTNDSVTGKDTARLLEHLRRAQRPSVTLSCEQPGAVTPRGDNRSRSSKSVKLWVVTRNWSKDKDHFEACGILESVERTVYRIEGREGEWVQYGRRFHPLHSAEEFSAVLVQARKRKQYFFNNELGGRGEALRDTAIAAFIYYDERSLPYW